MPSGHRPIQAKRGELGGENCLVPVPLEAIEHIRAKYEPALRFVDEEFETRARQVYENLGSPSFSRSNGWNLFFTMLEILST
jgi:hypothetical protein